MDHPTPFSDVSGVLSYDSAPRMGDECSAPDIHHNVEGGLVYPKLEDVLRDCPTVSLLELADKYFEEEALEDAELVLAGSAPPEEGHVVPELRPVPHKMRWIIRGQLSTVNTYNFARQIAREEILRFARIMDKFLEVRLRAIKHQVVEESSNLLGSPETPTAEAAMQVCWCAFSDGEWHSILGNTVVEDRKSNGSSQPPAQRSCDQRLVMQRDILDPYRPLVCEPTCIKCREILELRAKFAGLGNPAPEETPDFVNEGVDMENDVTVADEQAAIPGNEVHPTITGTVLVLELSEYYRDLSQQVGKWSTFNFGDSTKNPPHRQVLGMIEELSEMRESLAVGARDGVIDGAGDVVIYMADYFYHRGWDLGSAWRDSGHNRAQWGAMTYDDLHHRLCRKLAHHHLKGEQNIRGGKDHHSEAMQFVCSITLDYLSSISEYLGVSLTETVKKTWAHVSKRNWVANPNNAAEVASGQAG